MDPEESFIDLLSHKRGSEARKRSASGRPRLWLVCRRWGAWPRGRQQSGNTWARQRHLFPPLFKPSRTSVSSLSPPWESPSIDIMVCWPPPCGARVFWGVGAGLWRCCMESGEVDHSHQRDFHISFGGGALLIFLLVVHQFNYNVTLFWVNVTFTWPGFSEICALITLWCVQAPFSDKGKVKCSVETLYFMSSPWYKMDIGE